MPNYAICATSCAFARIASIKFFGNPANLAPAIFVGAVGPVALRPPVTRSLLVSEIIFNHILVNSRESLNRQGFCEILPLGERDKITRFYV